MTGRQLLTALVVVALVGSVLPAVGSVAAQPTENGVTVEQTESGSLLVTFDNESYPDRHEVELTVSADNESSTLETRSADLGVSSEWGREAPLGELPDRSLADARVTVAYNGSSVFDRTMDLRYLGVDTTTARFGVDGGLVVNASSAGLGDGSVELRASPNDGESITMAGSIDDAGLLRFDRAEFEELLLPPKNVTLSAVDGGGQVEADGHIDLAERADSTASLLDGAIVVSSDLLVDGQQYDVTVTSEDPSGTYVSAANASERQLTLRNEYVGGGTVSVTVEGTEIVNSSLDTGEALSGSVDNGTVSIDGELPAGNVDRVILESNDRVQLLDNVTVGQGTVSLPTANLSDGGTYTLVLLSGSESATIVETGDGGPLSPLGGGAESGAGTATPSAAGPLPAIDTPVLIAGGVAFIFFLSGIGFIGYRRLSPSGGGATGAASSPRRLTVSVVDGHNHSRIEDSVTVEATPQQEKTREGYRVSASTRTAEITGGRSTIEVPRKAVELETTYNGISTSEYVDLADSDRVELVLGPVSRSLTVRDAAGEPVAGATVAIRSGGETHLTRETDENGRVAFDLSVSAADFEVVVDHDRFEPASHRVADPSAFPESVSLIEETGTLRVRTTIDGEATDAVDLRIEATEGTRSENAPTVDEPSEPGIYEFADVPIGSYDLFATVEAAPFDGVRESVDIDADAAVMRELDVEFQYALDGHRSALESLRTEADGLVPSSRVDTAIHSYFANVAHDLADVVESLPDEAVRFAETGDDPDAVAESLLAVGRDVVTLVDNALNRKQNVDLFNACADLPAATVEFDEFDVGELFELTQQDRIDQDNAARERISELADRVEAEQDQVNIISPASDVLDELRDYARGTQTSDPVRNAAVAFVVVGFSDAVEGLFEHRQLRNRLQYAKF